MNSTNLEIMDGLVEIKNKNISNKVSNMLMNEKGNY